MNRKMLLISTLLILLILYFCGRQIITSISILAINIFIGYYVLFLLCSYLMERKKFVNQKELFDYYKLTGIPMIILSSFKEFGKNILDVQNKIFFFKRKRSYNDDKKKIFLRLIDILDQKKIILVCPALILLLIALMKNGIITIIQVTLVIFSMI